MGSYGANDLKNGVKLMIDGDPCVVMESEFVKPGKGQAFTRIKIKNLISGRTVERTYKSNESVEGADVMDADMQYLYNDGEFWYFMHPETFEQISADAKAVGDNKNWLREQELYQVTSWNENPIQVTPPNFVVLKVAQTDPGVKGDTAQGATKPATLETGAVIKVPLFVDVDELVKVDTRSGEYVSRAKE